MRWTRGERSEDLEDRRGESSGRGSGLRVGGGVGLGGAVILLVLSLVFGQNFFALLDGGGALTPAPGGGAPTGPARKGSPAEEQAADFMSFVLDDVQNTWAREFTRLGHEYERAKLVLFTDAVRSGCGAADAAAGPFYCPEDRKVYIDLGFYNDLKNRFGAPGDFAQAYVLAHEIGHHVQRLLGLTDQVRGQQSRPDRANAPSVPPRRWATTASRSRPAPASRPRPGPTARPGSARAGSGAGSSRAGCRIATPSAPPCRVSRSGPRCALADRGGPGRCGRLAA